MPSILYHVTETSSVPSIRKHGIRRLYPSIWTTGTGKRYGEGEIFAFEKFADAMKWATHMEWELHKDLGTGSISIVEFIKEGKWEIDTNDPISQSGKKGHWLKKHGHVPAENIVSVKPVTSTMVKKFIADSNKEYKATSKQATNPPRPHMTSRTYGGGPDPSNEDPRDRVTISIEEDEDLISDGIRDTKLDLFFAKIGEFARGTPGIYKAFGLSTPDPIYNSKLGILDHDSRRDVVIAMMFGVHVDLHQFPVHGPGREDIASELVQAAFDEVKLRGAYGIFAKSGFADYRKLLLRTGFTETDVRGEDGYQVYVKIFGKPDEVR
jgi:hypothetical protein